MVRNPLFNISKEEKNMGFIIDSVFAVSNMVDDVKLNIQDLWYEKKMDHYINKYHQETGQYPGSVVNDRKKPTTSNYQPFTIPGTVYNGVPLSSMTTPPVTQEPVVTVDNTLLLTDETPETETDPLLVNETDETSEIETDVGDVEPVKDTSSSKITKAAEAKAEKITAKKQPVKTIDPAEKEAPVENAEAEKYPSVDAFEGKTEHLETVELHLKDQSVIDNAVKNMADGYINEVKTKTTTKRSSSKKVK